MMITLDILISFLLNPNQTTRNSIPESSHREQEIITKNISKQSQLFKTITQKIAYQNQMRALMKSISSLPELNNKSWSFFLGANSIKQYAITRYIYEGDNHHQNKIINNNNNNLQRNNQNNGQDPSIDVIYMDGLIKNHRQFQHAKRISKLYNANFIYVDSLQLLVEKIICNERQGQLNKQANYYDPGSSFQLNSNQQPSQSIEKNIENTKTVIVSTFDSITLLKDMFNKQEQLGFSLTLSNVDLLLCYPYLGDYSDIQKQLAMSFMLLLKNQIITAYKQLADSNAEYDYLVQRLVNCIDLKELHKEIQRSLNNMKMDQKTDSNNDNKYNIKENKVEEDIHRIDKDIQINKKKQQEQDNNIHNKNDINDQQNNVNKNKSKNNTTVRSLSLMQCSSDSTLFINDIHSQQEYFDKTMQWAYTAYQSRSKTQYILDQYSPIMSLPFTDPVAVALENILKGKQ